MNETKLLKSEMKKKRRIYLIAIIALFILHFAAGIFGMPAIVYKHLSEDGSSPLPFIIGYGFGTLLLCGIIFPVVVSLLTLIKKTYRNIFSFSKVYLYLCIVGLVINILLGIITRTMSERGDR